MEITSVKIDVLPETNLILGQAHFIKTVEDLYEALVSSVPGIKFGIAFCEASMERLVRQEVCNIFCATANPVEVVIARTGQGGGILGVVDGMGPAGIETGRDVEKRKAFLRTIGYKR